MFDLLVSNNLVECTHRFTSSVACDGRQYIEEDEANMSHGDAYHPDMEGIEDQLDGANMYCGIAEQRRTGGRCFPRNRPRNARAAGFLRRFPSEGIPSRGHLGQNPTRRKSFVQNAWRHQVVGPVRRKGQPRPQEAPMMHRARLLGAAKKQKGLPCSR